MSELILDLQAEDNWQLAHNDTISAARRSGVEYYPIRPFELPILLESPIIVAIAENVDAKPWWYLGCRLQQLISTGIAPGEVMGTFTKVPINRPKLIRFPRVSAQYSLRVEVPPWYDRMKIAIYEYVGTIGDSTEQLLQDNTDLIRIDLLRIEAKINNS